MHGLPKDFDFSIFVGRELQSITFFQYTLCFGFDSELTINLESSYGHSIDADAEEDRVDVPPIESTLMQLIGRTVERAEADYGLQSCYK